MAQRLDDVGAQGTRPHPARWRGMANPVPDSGAALLVIDMINRLDFPGAERILPAAEAATDAIVRLRDQADAAGVPVIYCNDNHGDWKDDRAGLVRSATGPGVPGRAIAAALAPRPDDYFVVKPQFSSFYATTLPAILPRLGIGRLVLTGLAADICVLFTAADAHMREYRLWTPADAVAGEDPQRTRWALDVMKGAMGAATRPARELSLADWIADGG